MNDNLVCEKEGLNFIATNAPTKLYLLSEAIGQQRHARVQTRKISRYLCKKKY